MRILLLLFLLSWPLLASAQFDDPEIPEIIVRVQSALEPSDPRPGEHVRIVVTAQIEKGLKIYSVVPSKEEFAPIASALEWDAGNWESLGPFYETNPISEPDPVLGMILSYHKGESSFYQNFKVPSTDSRESAGEGRITFQACSDRVCLPPDEVQFSLPAAISSGSARSEYSVPNFSVNPDMGGVAKVAEATSLLGFLGLAVLAGFFALLTPCVLPMIPITVSFFTAQAQQSRGASLRLVATFALGLVGTYTILGMGMSLLFGAAGIVQLASNPWLNLAVGVLFVLFAVSLIGFLDFSLPPALINRLDSFSRKTGGLAGIFLIGVAFTFTAFTCTIQFVGTLLLAAARGEWFLPILGMLVFSTVFALPFILMGLFPTLIRRSRGLSGNWMEHLKIVLGILELGIAWKFFSNADLVWQWGVLDREVVLAAWAVLMVAIAAFLLGRFPIKGIRIGHLGPGYLGFGAVFLIFGLYFGSGVVGKELNPLVESYLPPPIQGTGDFEKLSAEAGLVWHDNFPEALAVAQETQKPLFLDFTGYTCVNCRWMEKSVFAKPEVLKVFQEEFVLAQLYTDGGSFQEANRELQMERFNTLALPFYVVLNASDQEIKRHAGIIPDPKDFLTFLEF
ncbi:MAG: cytochrome c biogenesis protein CcdA [bacterium]